MDVDLYPPVDYTPDYDSIISMLEMSTETEIELTQGEFDQYVMDKMRGHRFGEYGYDRLAFSSPGVFTKEMDESRTFFSNTMGG